MDEILKELQEEIDIEKLEAPIDYNIGYLDGLKRALEIVKRILEKKL